MPRRPDPVRLRAAKLTGAAMAVSDAVALASPDVVEAQRQAMPDLWERIDRLIELAVEAHA